jgi:hypothetical protein
MLATSTEQTLPLLRNGDSNNYRTQCEEVPNASLISWWVVLTAQMATAGAVLGAAVRVPLCRLTRWISIVALVLLILTIILQNVGIAPN